MTGRLKHHRQGSVMLKEVCVMQDIIHLHSGLAPIYNTRDLLSCNLQFHELYTLAGLCIKHPVAFCPALNAQCECMQL